MFLAASAPGIHVGDGNCSWIVRSKQWKPKLLGLSKRQAPPDISIDPDSGMLSFINAADVSKAFFVSIRGHACVGRRGAPLRGIQSPLAGLCNERGIARVTTFVVVVAAKELIDVCRIRGLRSPADADVHLSLIHI